MSYQIEEWMRTNWLALFEELIANGDNPDQLYEWFQGERTMIEQSIMELQWLEEVWDD